MSRTYKKKPWYKPDKSWKQPRRQSERSRLNRATKNLQELPVIKKNDVWDYA